MLNLELPRRACWTSETARAVFRTEALEGEDAVFLATHTPIRDFAILGSNGSDIQSATETGLLDALSHPARRHAFCAVQGEPGSGKSHLIRWLYVNWPKGCDLPILLRRSDGSLDGALQQLKLRLPAKFVHLFDRIGQKQKATVEGRAAVFHTTLAAMLRPNHYDPPLEDQEWCAHWSPATLLFSEHVVSRWKAPERIIRLVSGEGERNSATARFNLFDVADLVEILADEIFGASSVRKFLKNLGREVEEIIDVQRAEERSADEVARDYGERLPHAMSLVDALNRRRNDAIQNVLGVSAEGLKALFREVRRALAAEEGARLVLLLEDITSWEGLDDSLIDVLVTNSDTRGSATEEADLCDLISVVGLTPEYYRTLRGNYRQRITHEVRLGDGEHGLQDVVTVRDPDNRLRFVARYLAAARAGTDRLAAWRDEIYVSPGAHPPNACATCQVVDGCFKSFGDVDGVGLYPFTKEAIGGFFDALKEDDAGMTWKTPRGLIQAVLSPTLSQPEVLEQGGYPGTQIERSTFTEQSRHLSGALTRRIDARVNSLADQARLRRVFTFWGAGGRAETTHRPDGELLFHGVPRSVFQAFQLPWLGEEQPVTGAKPLRPVPAATPSSEPAPAEPRAEAPVDAFPTGSQPLGLTAEPLSDAAPLTPKPATKRASTLRLDAEDIRTWRDSGKLKNPANWNRAAFEIIQKLDPRRLEADPWVWERCLTQELVKLQGTGQERAFHFIVPAEDWVFDGLEAHAMLSGKEELTPDEVEFYRHQMARMMRRLEGRITDFLNRRLSVLEDGLRWDPAAAAALVLLVRAWLRRATLPTAATSAQWAALLSDEAEADSSPKVRTQVWQSFLDATSKRHGDLRDMLRRMIATPQGGAQGFGLAGGKPARAVVALIQGLRVDAVPSEAPTQPQSTKIVEVIVDLVRRVASDLPSLLVQERDLLSARAQRVSDMLRGRSLRDHAARVDAALTQASEQLPSVAADRVRAWKLAYERLKILLDDDTQRREVEDTIYQFVDDLEALPTNLPGLLSCLITARAGGLDQVREAFAAGEAAVDAILIHVQTAVQAERPSGGGLATIHQAGARLRAAAADAQRRLLSEESE